MDYLRNIKMGIEVPILLTYFCIMCADPVNTNFIIYRTCYVILGYNETDCSKLGGDDKSDYTKDLEKTVEPYANVISMTVSMLSQIFPVILCLFIGPWSDTHGRRPFLILTTSGFIMSFLIKTIISMIPNASPWLLLAESIPIIVTGGYATFMMISLCYLTDVTTTSDRGLRMGIFETMLALGMLLGTTSSSYIFKGLGYTGVYSICILLLVISWIFIVYLVPESVAEITDTQNGSSLFSVVHIKDMIRTTLKRREENRRIILLLSIISLVLFIFAMSNGNSMFLYVREQFDWSLQKYTNFLSMSALMWILGTIFGVCVLHKMIGIDEVRMLLIGFAVLATASFIKGLATKDWHIYEAAAIHSLGGVTSPMLRSLISKTISTEEVGKVFSLTISLESFMMLLCGPIYTLIYNSTLDVYPGAFNIFQAVLYVLEFAITLVIMVLLRRQTPYDVLHVN